MVAGPRSPKVTTPASAGIAWTRAALAWMLMMLVETANGFAREVFIAPEIGALHARQIGVLAGTLLVLAIAWACSRWIGARTRGAQLAVGAFWVFLTVAFELAVGRAMQMSWPRLLARMRDDYDPARGGFMLAGLVVMLLAPWLVSRWTHDPRR